MLTNKPEFIPGLQLNEMFYQDVVKAILATHFPGLAYSAGLVGYGSDVLGFDTPTSTDHNWGPRLQLFLAPPEYEKYRAKIHDCLRQQLPLTFRAYSVNFSGPDLSDGGTQRMQAIETGPVNHLVEIYTLPSFFKRYLDINPYQEIQALDWLTFSEQALLEVAGGRVYYDGLGELEEIRAGFAYYPADVWLYRLASQWQRISQEEAFMGRCGDIGDELGSRLVAARLTRDLMKLSFLMEKQYAPYSKWLGVAFARLECGPELSSIFNHLLAASPWTERQKHLDKAYLILAEMHNNLGITDPLDPKISDFFNRPYHVLFAARFADAIKATITDETIKNINIDIGGVDQFADCTDLTSNPQLSRKLRLIYEKD